MWTDGPMLLAAISCLPRDIAAFWNMHSEQSGRTRRFHAGHFRMLVDPLAVTTALVELIKQMGEKH